MYPAVKHFPLNLAATIFLGAGIGAERTDITRAFLEMVKAVVAPIRTPLPGTQMRRGVRVGEYVVSYLIDQIPIRRDRGGDNLFSPLCRATTDDSALFSPRAMADHMNFLLVAAHDTVTSALTAFIWMMAANPDWQHRLRGEVAALGPHDDALLRYDQLESMPLTE